MPRVPTVAQGPGIVGGVWADLAKGYSPWWVVAEESKIGEKRPLTWDSGASPLGESALPPSPLPTAPPLGQLWGLQPGLPAPS